MWWWWFVCWNVLAFARFLHCTLLSILCTRCLQGRGLSLPAPPWPLTHPISHHAACALWVLAHWCLSHATCLCLLPTLLLHWLPSCLPLSPTSPASFSSLFLPVSQPFPLKSSFVQLVLIGWVGVWIFIFAFVPSLCFCGGGVREENLHIFSF